ncbi:MAG: cofactor-independent phosphoglycerate mutase [Candidatus Omnitrophota bacterium]|nr:cofactor-independent phosphoglycerate mutase [Candidatus Omnitrophota bacterium]
MKTFVLVLDGMADEPVEQLEGKTPLEAAKTPHMDRLAREGKIGLARTIPKGFTPASDVGNLAILGYDPKKYYCGRGPLEAANLGIELAEGDVAFRCNLITADGDKLADYTAGFITTDEARGLIEHLGKEVRADSVRFYPGMRYRHLAVFRDPPAAEALLKTTCSPPHDIAGWNISDHWPKGPAAKRLIGIMESSRKILTGHEVNQVRVDLKENPANMIWLWGQGTKAHIPTYQERWGMTGAVISAVDLVKGAGKLAGLEVIDVPGATGYYDTNYEGKAKAALKSLKKKDVAYLHVEAADEAGHNGDLRQKISAIENFDRLVVGTILEHAHTLGDVRILVIPDHPTPVEKRAHSSDPVPFVIWGQGIAASDAAGYGESLAKSSGWFVEEAHEILPRLLTEERM